MGSDTSEDLFDRIPDSLLLLIFNKFGDIKALGRCKAVSSRFSSLVPQVHNVVVKVDCVIPNEDSGMNSSSGSVRNNNRGIWAYLVKLMMGSFAKPWHIMQQIMNPRKSVIAEISHHSPCEVLKNFKEIKNLKIELPGGELGVDDGVLLKWRAQFGSTLDNCVILGASSVSHPATDDKLDDGQADLDNKPWLPQENGTVEDEDSGNIPESFYTNGGLKLRVVWTISSLIAASARHYLLQNIISEHQTLESLMLTDSDLQGVLRMNKQQLQEFRNKPLAASASSNRTQVPALNMKLWYAPYLDLPCGMILKGATLVSIRPSDHPICKEADGLLSGAFEEPYKTAVSLLARRRTYLLEMNSF